MFNILASYLLAEDEPPADLPKLVTKGVCPICGKTIGRGVFLHARKCKGPGK